MNPHLFSRCWPARRLGAALALAVCALPVAGCLGEPTIEDRWTRIDLLSTNLSANQALTPGTTDSITVSAAITYRSILTGFAVCELRASSRLTAADVALAPNAPREPMAYDIDRLLANSVSVGRDARPFTGWDHLIQHMQFTFRAGAPTMLDSSSVPIGAPTGLFLVCYLGSGDKIERQDGSDTVIVTPFNSSQYQILPVGLELGLPATPVAH